MPSRAFRLASTPPKKGEIVRILQLKVEQYARQAWALVSDQPAELGQMAARKAGAGWEVGLADGGGWLAVTLISEQSKDGSSKPGSRQVAISD
jgi:hypothetical protein